MAFNLPITWNPRVSTSDNGWPVSTRLKSGAEAGFTVTDIDTINVWTGLNQIILETNRQLNFHSITTLIDTIKNLKTDVNKAFIDNLIAKIKLIRGRIITPATKISRTLIRNLRNGLAVPTNSVTIATTSTFYSESVDGLTQGTQAILSNQLLATLSTGTCRRFYIGFTIPTADPVGNPITTIRVTNGFINPTGLTVNFYLIPGTLSGSDFNLILSGTQVFPGTGLGLDMPNPGVGNWVYGVAIDNDIIAPSETISALPSPLYSYQLEA